MLAQELLNVQGMVIMFELLNEVSDASGSYPFSDIAGEHYDFSHKESLLWNKLYKRCIERIRRIDPDRFILVGSNGQNSVVYLKELEILDDPAVFYNFHYYDPQVFTHQQADFSEEMRESDQAVGYPDDISGFAAYLDAHLMERLLQHAIDFIKETGKELYCGEFGVIAHAPAQASMKWASDLTEILGENHIGYALWNYKYLDFGLLDMDGKPCSSLFG